MRLTKVINASLRELPFRFESDTVVKVWNTATFQLGSEGLFDLPEHQAVAANRECDLIVAMVAARILRPESKLATTRWWHTTTLAADLGVQGATEDDLYAAMDWLLERQDRIEKKLTARHLEEEGLVLYDLTSSYFEGEACPLAARGTPQCRIDRQQPQLIASRGVFAIDPSTQRGEGYRKEITEKPRGNVAVGARNSDRPCDR